MYLYVHPQSAMLKIIFQNLGEYNISNLENAVYSENNIQQYNILK
jgi:hypothetical protein